MVQIGLAVPDGAVKLSRDEPRLPLHELSCTSTNETDDRRLRKSGAPGSASVKDVVPPEAGAD
jgi:hypothetical protein